MPEYVYRLMYRRNGGEWMQYRTYGSGARPYTTVGPVKAIRTRDENRMLSGYEYKIQRSLIAWEDTGV